MSDEARMVVVGYAERVRLRWGCLRGMRALV
jgi:succinate dehydrogenase flavin-adding protein (antitoxin of CptAB toxin-antitoxin module)